MKRQLFSVGAVLALTLLFVGCGPSSSHFKDVRTAVFDGNEKLNTSIELSVGVLPIWMAGTVAAFIDEPEVQEGREYLKHISRVDIGVYEVQDSLKGQFSAVSQRVKSSMLANGFEPLVLVREKNERVGVYVPMNEDKVARELFVVVMEKKQVVLVRARGNFEKIARKAFKNHAHELPSFEKVFKDEIVL